MAYIDVLPLETVKTYLRIDDTQNETDAELTSIVNSAFRYIERHTNILVYARNVDYLVINGCAKVYDYPINSVVSPASATEYEVESKHLYKNYVLNDADVETLTLNVGYSVAADVPDDIINLALVIIKVMFFDVESDKSFQEMLPQWGKEILHTNKRFII